MSFDAGPYEIFEWPEISDGFTGPDTALLVGNGASRAVWSKFGYGSLFDEAKWLSPGGFTPDDLAVFEGMGTSSFEQVLSALRTAVHVFWKMDRTAASRARACYDSVRQRLIDTVGHVHIDWMDCSDGDVLAPIGQCALEHGTVFTTNYDLLLYWAVMHVMDQYGNRGWFNDFFRQSEFVLDDAMLARRGVRLFYLHGALHLYRTKDGETRKLKYAEGLSILQLLQRLGNKGEVPLFVAEGDGRDKVRSIKSSDYLSYALEQYDRFSGRFVVFGHSLGEGDEHLVRPLRTAGRPGVAVSLHLAGKTEDEAVDLVEEWCRKLLPAEPIFFDSATHPMGDSRRRVR